jgi:hypothetical protein
LNKYVNYGRVLYIIKEDDYYKYPVKIHPRKQFKKIDFIAKNNTLYNIGGKYFINLKQVVSIEKDRIDDEKTKFIFQFEGTVLEVNVETRWADNNFEQLAQVMYRNLTNI